MQLKIEYLSVGSLKPYEKNAKRHPADQVDHIANSIREKGGFEKFAEWGLI